MIYDDDNIHEAFEKIARRYSDADRKAGVGGAVGGALAGWAGAPIGAALSAKEGRKGSAAGYASLGALGGGMAGVALRNPALMMALGGLGGYYGGRYGSGKAGRRIKRNRKQLKAEIKREMKKESSVVEVYSDDNIHEAFEKIASWYGLSRTMAKSVKPLTRPARHARQLADFNRRAATAAAPARFRGATKAVSGKAPPRPAPVLPPAGKAQAHKARGLAAKFGKNPGMKAAAWPAKIKPKL